MEAIQQKIREDRPELSASSMKSYLRNIRILYQKLNDTQQTPTNVDFLSDTQKVIDLIKDWKLSTKKTYLASIVVALKAFDSPQSIVEPYSNFMLSAKDEYNNKKITQKKTPKEAANWATLDELKKVLKLFASKIRRHSIRHQTELTTSDERTLLSYLVLSLYLIDGENHAPRRLEDYASMTIVRGKKAKIPDDDNNYLMVYSRNNKEFVFQRYKTKHIYKTQRMKVSRKLNTVINLWLKFNNTDDFLPLTPNALGKLLSSIFVKFMNKKISVNMIRHIYVSELYKDVPALTDLRDKASQMGHTVNEAMGSYVKTQGVHEE
mgnify:CR=1 FL=1